MNKIGAKDSPTCACGKSEETVTHYLLECELYEEERDKLEYHVRLLTGQPSLTEELLLAHHQEDITTSNQSAIKAALFTFIEETRRFVKSEIPPARSSASN